MDKYREMFSLIMKLFPQAHDIKVTITTNKEEALQVSDLVWASTNFKWLEFFDEVSSLGIGKDLITRFRVVGMGEIEVNIDP
jgi:hypothetical protein